MMLVRAKTGLSTIHSVGLFAKEFIPKGAKVWEFTEGFDLVLTKEEVKNLSEAAREQFFNYAYLSKKSGKYVLCSDDARFFNHQIPPNVTCRIPEESGIDEALECFAAKDIQTGEELTNNYEEFDADPSDVI
ncbi:MAG: SET domain-containing protein [Candidatus Kaiserbacteria bacterium]|nr:SET domain-containing protein [Candidatus Kaiserbacteria bacterium]